MPATGVLIVEDEGVIAADIGRRLTRLGYSVVGTADTGDAAVALAAALRPDLVLMDIRLKGPVDGIAAAERIRQARAVPVVYLTAHADEATLGRAKLTEPFGYILKPLHERDLRSVIEIALYKHAAEAERGRLEEQVRQAQKLAAVGQLAGGVAHDFNNLLTVITGYGQLFQTALAPEHPWAGMVGEIVRAADRAADLTRQLLAFSRKTLVQPRPVDLNAAVQAVAKMLGRLLGGAVELVTDLSPGLGPVTADPGQLEQVLVNLAVNARDAMPDGGRLTLRTADVVLAPGDVPDAPPGAYRRLTVADTGVGMTPEVQARIFEPFFTTKEFGKGTGLGLATVYGIVRQGNGFVTVRSEVGAGTAFDVYLPPAAPGAVARHTPIAPPPLARGVGTVLLAEDDEAVRGLTRRVLVAAGYTVIEARDGVEALERLAAHDGPPVDLLLTDLLMPRLGGRELAARVARDRPGIKVLCVSGYADPAAELPPGAVFLRKPFSPAVLTRTVRELLAPDPAGSA